MRKPETKDTFRLSVTGIDGAGKDSALSRALQELSAEQDDVAIKLGRPSYVYRDGQEQQVFQRTTDFMNLIHEQADSIGSREMVFATNALATVINSRVVEPLATHRYDPDILGSSRDTRLDSLVYSSYYGGSGAARINYSTRGKIIQNITGVNRDLIVLMQISPQEAMKRIRQRTEDSYASAVDKRSVVPRHLHENPSDLARLAERYEEVLAEVEYLRDTPIVRIDTTSLSIEEATEAVKKAIGDTRSNKHHNVTES